MDKLNEIVLRERERSFHISRITKKTKEEIIKFADDEFNSDYGMVIQFIWNKFKEITNIELNQDIKLNYIIQLLEKDTESEQEEKKPKVVKRMLSGRIVEKEVKNE